jgi:hypothetical protein
MQGAPPGFIPSRKGDLLNVEHIGSVIDATEQFHKIIKDGNAYGI